MKPILTVASKPGFSGYRAVKLNGVAIGVIGTEACGQPFLMIHSALAVYSEAKVYVVKTHRPVKDSICVTLRKGGD